MKKIIILILIIILCASSLVVFEGCAGGSVESDCVRIHIRANSNSAEDQAVKMIVVEAVTEYLTPYLARCDSALEAEKIICGVIDGICQTAEDVLCSEGMSYSASATLKTEYFPTRKYGKYVFDGGEYRALIVELGTGEGDNWWCVAFPPLCFVPQESSKNFTYKSRILELIEKYQKEDE